MALDFSYTGSFQHGLVIRTENPLEVVWEQISRIGTSEYASALTPEKPQIDWTKHTQYACVRIRQALELRRSSDGASVLTKPLVLYYSFLNLLRACMALGPEVISPSKHGLIYRPYDQLLLNEAEFDAGTFTTYLNSLNVPWTPGTRISLQSSLSKIPEIATDFNSPNRGKSDALPVSVEAKMGSKAVRLHFDQRFIDEQTFRMAWPNEFPTLKDFYELEDSGATLKLKQEHQPNDYGGVCTLCEKTMLYRLVLGNDPVWHVVRHKDGELNLPRAAYYFIAMFILGNVVRYQPELFQRALPPASEPEWFFERFLRSSERFFPQLMISWLERTSILFSVY